VGFVPPQGGWDHQATQLGTIKPHMAKVYLPLGLGRLTQLTKLDFQYSNQQNRQFEPLRRLTQLQDLTFRLGHGGDDAGLIHSIAPLLPPSTLTRLCCRARMLVCVEVPHLHPLIHLPSHTSYLFLILGMDEPADTMMVCSLLLSFARSLREARHFFYYACVTDSCVCGAEGR